MTLITFAEATRHWRDGYALRCHAQSRIVSIRAGRRPVVANLRSVPG